VVVDQFYDHTKSRPNTFFEDGIAGHIAFADPVCPALSGLVHGAARKAVKRVHRGGTYLCMEGPAFSTRAESAVYRKWGVDVIGMTNMPEARLAREAELCYATLALATDYDVWHDSHAAVTVEAVVANLMKNVATAKVVLGKVIPQVGQACGAGCGDALASAVITAPTEFPPRTRKRLGLLLDRYYPPERRKRG
jgi:5'-methylthioadenosine phosphorylase